MKQQYSSNYDDPFVANQRLKNKLDFLQRESIKREAYLKQVERNIKLCKQTIKSQNEKVPNQHLMQLHQQNTLLLANLAKQHANICKLNTLYLMQCQLRIQQSKTYNDRILEFEENIQQLRRYLHDKEESFSYVVEKLKKYEEVMSNEQLILFEKLIIYSGTFRENFDWKVVISGLQEDRNYWKEKACLQEQKNKKLEVAIHVMRNHENFQSFMNSINSLSQEQINTIITNANSASLNPQSPINSGDMKNIANLSTNLTYSQNKKSSIEPNVQLIRLMKKQKFNNKVLQAALSQALQKNFELMESNIRLIDSNDALGQEVDYIIADMVVLCNALQRYDYNYRTKIKVLKHRAKCDLQLPLYKEILQKYKRNSLSEAKQILFIKMRNDVEELSEYIALCPFKKTNVKSFESPRRMANTQNQVDFTLNSKQFSINQL